MYLNLTAIVKHDCGVAMPLGGRAPAGAVQPDHLTGGERPGRLPAVPCFGPIVTRTVGEQRSVSYAREVACWREKKQLRRFRSVAEHPLGQRQLRWL